MLFAMVLGAIIGAAGVTLLRQWVHAALTFEEPRASQPVMNAMTFPHLAPSERVPRYSPRLWHRAA